MQLGWRQIVASRLGSRGEGLSRARTAGTWRVRPIIRLRSRWAPSPAIKMLIGPGSPAAPRPGPPGRMLVPAPASDRSGCGSAIRGRPRPAPAPREHLPRKMNVPPLPRPGSRATKRPGPSPPSAALGGDAGGSGAPRRRRRGAELSTLRAPPPARPRVARPPRASGPAQGHRAQRQVHAPPARPRPALPPQPPLRPWSPRKWAAGGPKPPDSLWGRRQWQRRTRRGDICPRWPLCGSHPLPRILAPHHWPPA